MEIIRISEKDNVAVALCPLKKGQMLSLPENPRKQPEALQDGVEACEPGSGHAMEIRLSEDIPQGHKLALCDLKAGEPIVKYGFPIGHATLDIPQGAWVHTHNMATNLSGEVAYTYQPEKNGRVHAKGAEAAGSAETFSGFRRPDGKAGIRNEIWVIPVVGCVNDVAERLVRENQDLVQGTIDGLYAFPHPYGCSQTGADHAQTRKLLCALAKHPNAGAVLMLSLGCENLTHEQVLAELGEFDRDRIRFLCCQEVGDEFAEGRRILQECVALAAGSAREEIPVSELVVGMKCGGSDGLSGITANPLCGRFTDLLTGRGGSAVLTEVPEMFGAEGFLMNRCENEAVFDKACRMLNGFKDYFISHHEVVYDNPSPGNRAGGITTLEDKSCGCVQKGGTAPITDVIGYGDPVTKKGLNLLYGPGNDLVSATALTAAGCQLILFTTGRGTPFGAPAPTVKLATNSQLYQRKPGWMDFDAGPIAQGESLDEAGDRLYRFVLEIARGRKTKAEENGYRGIAIFKDGVTL